MRIMFKGELYSVQEIEFCDDDGVNIILPENRQLLVSFKISKDRDDFMQRMLVEGYAEIIENRVVWWVR